MRALELRVSAFAIGLVALAAMFGSAVDGHAVHHFVWSPRPTNSCTLIPLHTKVHILGHGYDGLGYGEEVDDENALFALRLREEFTQYWYCDKDQDLPWPELDLNWCLANWHDGKLVPHDGCHFGNTDTCSDPYWYFRARGLIWNGLLTE